MTKIKVLYGPFTRRNCGKPQHSSVNSSWNYIPGVPEYKAEGFMPWLKQIAAGLFLQRPRFNPRPVHVGFVVNKVAMRQALVFSGYFYSRMSVSFYPCSIFIHLLPSYIISLIDNDIK